MRPPALGAPRWRSLPHLARRLLLGAALLAGGGLLGACGIPTDAQPIALSSGQLPQTLRPPSEVSAPVKASNPPGTTACKACLVKIYFFLDPTERVVPAYRYLSRPLASYSEIGRLQQALNELDRGTTRQEFLNGIVTWLFPSPQLTVLNLQNGLVTIGLDENTASYYGYQYQNAISQVVWTIDDPAYFPYVKAVAFDFAGASYPVLLANGDLDDNPVTTKDFEQYAPAASGGASTSGSTGS